MIRKMLGLSAFALIGFCLMVLAIINEKNLLCTVFLILTACFFSVGIKEHFNDLKNREMSNEN